MPSMKIGIVCYPTYGGSGVLATELGLGLASRGHQVHFITYHMPARLLVFHENIFFHEVHMYDYPLFEYEPYESALASKLVHVVCKEKLDILHVHYAIPHASAAHMAKQILAAKGVQIPFVTTLHGTDITLVGSDPSFAPVVEFSINASDAVTAVSQYLKNVTEHQFSINIPIEVIYNFVDLRRFKHSDKNHFKRAIAPNGERILIHVSNFRRVKRVEEVVRIFHGILSQLPSKLLLVGDGPDRVACEQLANQLGIIDHVIFLGKQEAIEEILSVSDLFMLPSATESFGLSALEAMACGVPVIASNVGGLPEVVQHGISGYLADVGDIDSMVEYGISLLKDDQLYAAFSQSAYEQSLKFNIDNIMDQYEQLYAKIIQANDTQGSTMVTNVRTSPCV